MHHVEGLYDLHSLDLANQASDCLNKVFWTGGIAHDFNNMLAGVIGALNIIQRRLERGDTNVDKFIDGALDSAYRAASLTQRLLAFSRQQPLAPVPLDVNKMAAGMTELLSRTLGETIQVETVLGAGLWTASGSQPARERGLEYGRQCT